MREEEKCCQAMQHCVDVNKGQNLDDAATLSPTNTDTGVCVCVCASTRSHHYYHFNIHFSMLTRFSEPMPTCRADFK